MSDQTDRWLTPMVKALYGTDDGPRKYLRLMEASLVATRNSDGTDRVNVDFVRFGNLIRQELGWDDYPDAPVDGREV